MAKAKRPEYGCFVKWSEEDQEYVATYQELPELSGLAPSVREAVQELETALDAWIEAVDERDLPPVGRFGNFVVIDRSRFGGDALASMREDIENEETSNESIGETEVITQQSKNFESDA